MESCTATIKAGEKFTIVVGKGGAGGQKGSGKYNNGKPGKEGHDSMVFTSQGWRLLASAQHGRPGQGGEASGNWESGYGGAGGAGTTGLRALCRGSDHVHLAGVAGSAGRDGYRNAPGQGAAGPHPALHVNGCSFGAGDGGNGGNGVGNSGGNSPYQKPAQDGRDGYPGCVALTYTP